MEWAVWPPCNKVAATLIKKAIANAIIPSFRVSANIKLNRKAFPMTHERGTG